MKNMLEENPKISIIMTGVTLISIVLGSLYLILSSDNGEEIVSNAFEKVIDKIPDSNKDKKQPSLNITFDKDNKPSVQAQNQAIKNLTIRTKQTLQETIYVIKMSTLSLTNSKNKDEIAPIYSGHVDPEKIDKLEKNVEDLAKIVKMSTNSDKVIRVSVKNVSKYNLFYKNIDIKREFFLAKLDELKISLDDRFLKEIALEESKKIYAQLSMIKSISYYLDYQPDEAYNYYELAKNTFSGLTVINDLKKEYQDIAPKYVKEIKFAYVLVASVPKSEINMKKTADRILSLNKATAFRKKNYNLYLSVNNTKIRVYTIVEYHSKEELKEKFAEVQSIEKTALIYDTSKKTPDEYILRETRKKIYVYKTSDRKNDEYLVAALKKKNYKQIQANGEWGRKFDIYAVYYDGNSCDDNDLESLLDDTRVAINSHAVSAYAYQQSKSKKIQELFLDKQLKYIIILEKNAYVKRP